jgi:predicted transcriptional regulator
MGKLLHSSLQKSIRKLRLEGKKVSRIRSILKVGKTSISKYANMMGCKTKRKVTKKLGARLKNTPQLQRRIKEILKKYPIKNVSEMKKRLKMRISLQTIRTAMKECKAVFSAPRRERFLNERQRLSRMEFAKEKLTNYIKWDDVIFVDEKRFCMDGPDGLAKEWHIKGDSKKRPF